MSDRERADADEEGERPEPTGAVDIDEATATGEATPEDVPVWDDDYVERVSGRLLHNFDLENGRTVAGESFTLYGRMEIESRKQLFHAALNYANHGSTEHLFVARRDGVGVADLEAYVEWAHELADEWIDADEEHFSTDFTVALVVPRIPGAVRAFVEGFKDRTLIRYGYYGHYEVNLVVVAPEREEVVTSRATDLDRAFDLWSSPDEEESSGLLGRFL
ncbi:hypothetical protein C475_01002 [Halosimplex carlsbadense 2-9-1]|uniref:DUF8052 domain-containing protein n=1 Tax=Halosimplex carlsbadense 2-9-1 TaxID=797114 RepID=M0D7Y6_9EURY|nr:hypothetical protein [Halosimplex carlsbadense]ELZ30269.1 hypothetical protein C475_01002 [Halosimplex carlsbadense 2-9-1]